MEMENELDAMGLWQALGSEEIERMCDEVKSETGRGSYEYFQHIAHRRRRPSHDLARLWVDWCEREHPEVKVSTDSLIIPINHVSYGKKVANG